MSLTSFAIAARFRGPPRSANGGYVCGRLASYLKGDVAVRLQAPPPLGVELRVETSAQHVHLFHAATLIATGRAATLDLQVPEPPSYEQAQAATQSFPGFKQHPFPGCFVCGPQRAPHDGLRIFPGKVDGTAISACPWIPDASLADPGGIVKPEFLWAALDCPGAFAVMPLPENTAIVLGELCAAIVGEVRADEPCVVMSWPLGTKGRKRFAGTAVYATKGRLIAKAESVWIEVPLKDWR